jgi:hypothetical protein
MALRDIPFMSSLVNIEEVFQNMRFGEPWLILPAGPVPGDVNKFS